MKLVQFIIQMLIVLIEHVPQLVKNPAARTTLYGVAAATAISLLAFCSEADEWHGTVFASTGVGLRFNETPFIDNDTSQPTAQFEFGARFDNGLSVQYTHRSEWFAGQPFNDNIEYFVDEIQIKYNIDVWRF